MRADEVLAILRAHFPELQTMGVRRLALFGSVARGEAHPDSDVDLLVDFEPPLGFDRYMDVKFRLEALLRRPVDLITSAGLKPELRPTIERECLRVP
jgi:uncharacterized protein